MIRRSPAARRRVSSDQKAKNPVIFTRPFSGSPRGHVRSGVALGLLTVTACTSKSPAPSARTLASFDHDSAACASVPLQGPPIVSTCLDAEPPQPQGGVVADGTYVLESMTYYGACPPSPDQARQTWVISGNEWDTAQEVPTTGDPDAGTRVWQVATTGMTEQDASAVEIVTCGPAAMGISVNTPLTWDAYSASPGHLVIFANSADMTNVRVDSFIAL